MSKTIFKSVQTIGTSFLLCTTLSTAIAQTTFTERGILETFHYDSPSPNIPIKEMVSIKTNTGKTIQFEAEEFTKKSPINLEHLTNKEVDIKYSINTTTPRSTLNKTPVKPTLLDIKAAPSTRAATTNTDWSFYGETIKGTRFFPVLMCKYSDSPAEVIVPRTNTVLTPTLVQQEFADATHYWKVNSQNNYELVTKVFGWYTLPFPRSAYFHPEFNPDPTARNFNADCMNAASADSFKLGTAYGVIFIEESPIFIGYALRGANLPKKNNRGTYNNLDGTVTQWTLKAAEVHFSNDAFLNNNIIHELGHAIGLAHSFYTGSTDKEKTQYRNSWDVMSQQWGLRNNNKSQYTLGYNRFKLGWLNDNQLSSYTLNSPTQTIKLETASLLQNVDKRLILLKYPNRPMVYSIELRGVQGGLATLDPNQQAIYFDELVNAPAVIIHSHVTDPGTTIKSTVINPGKEKTHFSSFNESVMLKQGESWTAPMIAPTDKAMFKITVDQVTDTGATVTVSTVVP